MPSVNSRRLPTPLRAIAILLVALLAAHAPLMLNDGLLMDDWLVLKPRPDYVVDIDFLLTGAGHPIFFSYDYLANLTGEPILLMKLLAFAGILLGATSLVLTAMRLDLLERREAVGFALVIWTYPGYQLWAGKANAVYVLSFGLLFVGAWTLTLSFGTRGIRHVLLRLFTALIFILSFALNSTIVLYAFLMLGLFVAMWRVNDRRDLVQRTFFAAWHCVIRYPELVMLPLVYWGGLNAWFKRRGVYAGHYNAHFPSLAELADGWKAFFSSGYEDVLVSAIRAARDTQAPFVLAAVLVTVTFFLLYRNTEADWSDLPRRPIALPLSLAAVLFLALSSPYLIAGLRPADHFYESRHLLMLGVPLALGLIAIKRLVEMVIGAKVAFALIFGLASVLSIAMLWNGYVFLQARVLKQEALTSHLAAMAKPAATVFALNDGFLDYPSKHVPFGLAEVSGMLRLAWGNQPFLGFTLRAERPTFLQEMEVLRNSEGSAFHHVDPSGPQATITLQPGAAAAPNAALVRHYYACRLLARCDVKEFLMQLAQATVTIGPIVGIIPLDHSKAKSNSAR